MYYARAKIKDRRSRVISARLSPWQQIEFMPEAASPSLSLSHSPPSILRFPRSLAFGSRPARALFQLFRLPAADLHKNNGTGPEGRGEAGRISLNFRLGSGRFSVTSVVFSYGDSFLCHFKFRRKKWGGSSRCGC